MTIKTHTVKSNAKRVARKLVEKFGWLDVLEPSAEGDAWVPVVGIRAQPSEFMPTLLPEGILEVAMVVLPEGYRLDGRAVLPAEPIATPATDPAVDAALAGLKPASKEAQVFALLRRPEGATIAQIADAMGWLPHTTRAFVSVHARKRGVAVDTQKTEAGRVYRVQRVA